MDTSRIYDVVCVEAPPTEIEHVPDETAVLMVYMGQHLWFPQRTQEAAKGLLKLLNDARDRDPRHNSGN